MLKGTLLKFTDNSNSYPGFEIVFVPVKYLLNSKTRAFHFVKSRDIVELAVLFNLDFVVRDSPIVFMQSHFSSVNFIHLSHA